MTLTIRTLACSCAASRKPSDVAASDVALRSVARRIFRN